MNLATCPDCKGWISPSATTCPKCGSPIKEGSLTRLQTEPKLMKDMSFGWWLVLLLILLIVIFGALNAPMSK